MLANKRPQKGDKFKVTEAFEGHVLTMWKAPFTGGDKREIPAGLEFVVAFDPPDTATAANVDAVPYAVWETVLVSEEDRAKPKYNGYYLIIPFDQIEAHCIRVS